MNAMGGLHNTRGILMDTIGFQWDSCTNTGILQPQGCSLWILGSGGNSGARFSPDKNPGTRLLPDYHPTKTRAPDFHPTKSRAPEFHPTETRASEGTTLRPRKHRVCATTPLESNSIHQYSPCIVQPTHCIHHWDPHIPGIFSYRYLNTQLLPFNSLRSLSSTSSYHNNTIDRMIL